MSVKEKMIELGELPYTGMTVTIHEDNLTAENCAAVLGFTDSREAAGEILLRLRNGRLMRVCGDRLILESMGGYGVRINGRIKAVSFIEL